MCMARCYRHSHGPHIQTQGACNSSVRDLVFETRLSFYINTGVDGGIQMRDFSHIPFSKPL